MLLPVEAHRTRNIVQVHQGTDFAGLLFPEDRLFHLKLRAV